MTATTSTAVPIVDYLVLGAEPHLRAHECSGCGARYFDRRNACAGCGSSTFRAVRVAAPGVAVPFAPAVIDCDGTSVRANIVNTPADPGHVRLGMPVRLTTYSLGPDSAGVEAIGYGFEPTD
jgi:uncharacterized OB-fold protein